MLLGRVTGTVVATRKEPLAEGWKLLVVSQLDAEDQETGGYVDQRGHLGIQQGQIYKLPLPCAIPETQFGQNVRRRVQPSNNIAGCHNKFHRHTG